MVFQRELMAAMWLIVAMLCFIIKTSYPPAWWATILGCITGLMGAIYFAASIIGPRCEREDIDNDDGTKLDRGEEDEQGPDDAGLR
jgi:hypothetical protein